MTTKIVTTLSGMFCALALASGHAATITSDNFSIAQGYVNSGGSYQFDTSETSSVNVSPGINFNLNVSVIGAALSPTGFTFINGVLGSSVADYASSYSSSVFSVALNASYVGPTPLDAAVNPDYKLQLNITSISIYAASFSAQGVSSTLGWTETTVGNAQAQTQQSIVTNPGPNWLTRDNYVNLIWTPNGFQTEGDAQGRTFGLAQSIPDNFALDGFLVTGNIVLTYTAVPEPGTIGLLVSAAAIGFFVVRRRAQVRA
jgi:hypothetical protein